MNEESSLQQKLNRETAKIEWQALEAHHQQGAVIIVDLNLDLITVAMAFAEDKRESVERWLKNGDVEKVSESTATTWSESKTELWAVVVAPWVLVQEIKDSDI